MTPPLDATPDTFPDRLFLATLRYVTRDRRARRALLRARHVLGLVLGQEFMRLRESGDPVPALFAKAEAADILVHCLRLSASLLGERLDRVPSRQRPHYTPAQRFLILEIRHLLGLTQKQTAAFFRLSMTTIALWESNANPDSKTVGAIVRPTPPIRRYCDTVHHLTQTLAQFGIRDAKAIVQHLARAGWPISKTTVRRYLQGPRIRPPKAPETSKRAVKARHPHHT